MTARAAAFAVVLGLVSLAEGGAAERRSPASRERPDARPASHLADTAAARTAALTGTTRLADEERLLAVRLAEKALEEKGLTDEGATHLVSAHWFHDKTSADLKALVTHYRTEGDLTIRSRVNLSSGTVEHQRTAVNEPTSLSPEEFVIARDLALGDERVKAALRGRGGLVVEPMVLHSLDPDDPLHGHRAVRLLFKDGFTYLRQPVVHVDLTAGTVLVEAEDPEGRP